MNKPYAEGVVPSGEEKEIIEDFDEEKEKLWKQEHRKRLKQAKQKEREEREKNAAKTLKDMEKTDDEIFRMLEEAEIMEELEQELDTLEVDEVNDDMLQKLLSGEMKLPQEKKRFAHNKDNANNSNSLSPNIVKLKDLDSVGHLETNNNVQPNQEIVELDDAQNDGDEGELEEETLPEEVTLIKQQAKYLDLEDQIGFYDYQIQIVKQKLQLLPLRTPQELNEKIHLLSVVEYLEELLEEAEEALGTAELITKDNDEENEKKLEENRKDSNESKTMGKRRISFALEDQTLEFRKHEAVTQMLPPRTDKLDRDIIKLDNYQEKEKEYNSNNVNKRSNKESQIKEKVQQNLEFVAENQSVLDFDLVGKILQSAQSDTKTLHIKFHHSQKESCSAKITAGVIGSPADIYNFYKNSQQSKGNTATTLFINGYEGEDQVKAPALREADRQSAFADPKSEVSVLGNKINFI